VVLQTDYDEIELLKNQLWRHFSNVIVIMSSINVTKVLAFPSKLLATALLPALMFLHQIIFNDFEICMTDFSNFWENLM